MQKRSLSGRALLLTVWAAVLIVPSTCLAGQAVPAPSPALPNVVVLATGGTIAGAAGEIDQGVGGERSPGLQHRHLEAHFLAARLCAVFRHDQGVAFDLVAARRAENAALALEAGGTRQRRFSAQATAKLVALLIIAFAAAPVLTVWTAVKLHLLSLSSRLGEKFLVGERAGVASTCTELEPIAGVLLLLLLCYRNEPKGHETAWKGRLAYVEKSPPFPSCFLWISLRTHFGSEGWGFESLRAR